MSYTEMFSSQWDMLIVKFRSYLQSTTVESITVKDVREWYRIHTFCWKSMVETEGLMLSQQNNMALQQDLLAAIDDFRFHEISDLPKKPKAAPYLIVGFLVAATAGVCLKEFLHIPIWALVLIAVACIFAPVFIYAAQLDQYAKRKTQTVVEGYVQQLQEYKQTLMDVCKKNI